MKNETLPDKLQRWIYNTFKFCIGILMGAFSYFGVMQFFPFGSGFRILSLFTIVPAFFFFVIFVHEMGHAIAAWILKYRVHFIAIGRVGFNPELRKFQEIQDCSENEIAGFIQYTPTWPLKGRGREIVISFCGPVATIILGLLLLLLHEKFGQRVEYCNLPKNTNIPYIVDETGESFYDPGSGPYSTKVSHLGYCFLAIVCFLDALFNLLPLKSGALHKSDGRNIFESFSKSKWTPDVWLSARADMAYSYGQVSLSDAEWSDVRKECFSHDDLDESYLVCLRHFAWIKTDPEAFVAATALSSIDDENETLRDQYFASCALINKCDQKLADTFVFNPENQNAMHHFANVLLTSALGNHAKAVKMIELARNAYLTSHGYIPEEEEVIFSAITDEIPLPKLKWESLN